MFFPRFSSEASRREMMMTALFLPFLPAAARAQAAGQLLERAFAGNRSAAGTKGEGGEGIRATPNMTLRNCTFRNLGNGAVRVPKPVDRLTIEDCEGDNLYRFLEVTASGQGTTADLTNFVLRRVNARNLEHGLARIRYASHSGLIEDVVAHARDRCDAYCVGFQLDDTAHDITYQRVEAHDFRESGQASNKYWNGDGFSDEGGNSAIRYLNCKASGCSDGGFDLKSRGVRLEGCEARANKRNFRLWGDGALSGCTSENPRTYGGSGEPAHFSFHGKAGRFIFERPVVRADQGNTAPIFLIEADTPVTIEIRDAEINAPSANLFKVDGPQPTIIFTPDRAQQRITVAGPGNA